MKDGRAHCTAAVVRSEKRRGRGTEGTEPCASREESAHSTGHQIRRNLRNECIRLLFRHRTDLISVYSGRATSNKVWTAGIARVTSEYLFAPLVNSPIDREKIFCATLEKINVGKTAFDSTIAVLHNSNFDGQS